MTKRKSDFTLPTLDDLFSSQAERDDAKLERVREIPLCELHPFKDHPFKIMKGEEMDRMIESIRKVDRNQVIRAAKTIMLDTVFMLKGGEEDLSDEN